MSFKIGARFKYIFEPSLPIIIEMNEMPRRSSREIRPSIQPKAEILKDGGSNSRNSEAEQQNSGSSRGPEAKVDRELCRSMKRLYTTEVWLSVVGFENSMYLFFQWMVLVWAWIQNWNISIKSRSTLQMNLDWFKCLDRHQSLSRHRICFYLFS